MRRWWLLAAGVVGLGCAGLLGPDEAQREAKLDEGDEAEQMRLRGDFEGAESVLKRRLAADPSDARSWRLLGDVNLSRGQAYPERWKENLGWALDGWTRSLQLDPTSCVTWGRYAAGAVSAAENEATARTREALDALPLKRGRTSCPGAAMITVEHLRQPSLEELAAAGARLGADPESPAALAAAAPWIREASLAVDWSAIPWQPVSTPPAPAAGTPFVVLTRTTASSVEGSEPRPFTGPEWIVPKTVTGDRIVFLDRRFAATVPEKAVTRAPGCPGTTWDRQGTAQIPVGQCKAGPQDRRASEIFDPAILRVAAGAAHYHQPSIAPATIAWETVAASVRCLGGPVGRFLVDVPTCEVAYDKAIPQTRAVSAGSGRSAASVEHAERMVFAAGSGPLYGDEVAAHLAAGEVGVGVPYPVFVWTQPELTGCRGRGVFQKLQIVDGAVEFTCAIRGVSYRFRDLQLVAVGSATEG